MTQSHDVSEATQAAPLCHIVTPVGMLGYGFNESQVDAELDYLASQSPSIPTAIILDSGSTDSGPAKLALGEMTCPRSSYKRDLVKLLSLVNEYHVPLLFSSAGGDGSNDHVDEMVEIIKEIVKGGTQKIRPLKVLTIYSEITKPLVKERFIKGQIQGCGKAVPDLTLEDIEQTPRIVAQMGAEPFLDAMFGAPDFDIIISGRAYDPSPYVAYAAFNAMKSKQIPLDTLERTLLGGFFHMGKIMECGAQCATPKSKAARATVFGDGSFAVTPLEPGAICTPLSVAAHTLYEKSRPDLLYGPGGCLDLTKSSYTQLEDNKSIRVQGAIFRLPSSWNSKYTVKLEAATVIGYRSIFIGAMKDPILTSQIDDFLDRVQAYVKSQHENITEKWQLAFHKFGAIGDKTHEAGEIFIVGEALAETEDVANSVTSTARVACAHGPYPGQKATSGNFAMGIGGKMEFDTGLCAKFCIYHLMNLEDGEQGAYLIKETKSANVSDPTRARPLFSWNVIRIGTENHINGNTNKTNGFHRKIVTPSANGIGQTRKPETPEIAMKNGGSSFRTIGDVARVIRSKNAGPFELTFDILFDSSATYQAIKAIDILNSHTISSLYSVKKEDIIYCGFFDQALAFKATIPRMRNGERVASGGYMEDDVHGSQQYLALKDLQLPEDFASILKKSTSL